MNDHELKELVASLATAQKETDRHQRETDRQLKELGKQIGGLGEKFGSFTEGLALPSMSKILSERFGMEVVSPSVRVSKQGEHMEIDVLRQSSNCARFWNASAAFSRSTGTRPPMAFWRRSTCRMACGSRS